MDFEMKFDFGSVETPGWICVDSKTFYDGKKGYGFSNAPAGEIEAEGRKDSLYGDGIDFGTASFDVDLPDGYYIFSFTKATAKRAIIYVNGAVVGMNVDMYGTEHIPYGSTYEVDLYISGGKARIALENSPALSALKIKRIPDGTKRRTHVFIIGDSTVCDYYPIVEQSPEPGTVRAGWGQIFLGLVSPDICVHNMAASGSYARQYYEALWFDGVLNSAEKGDYILIQFGINDRTYDSIESMKAVLGEMVDAAAEKGVIPVLINPQISVKFWGIDAEYGKPTGGGFAPFFAAVRDVAKEKGTLFIDLTAISSDFFGKVGRTYTSQNYYLYDRVKNEQVDGLHLAYQGAKKVAEFVADEIKRQQAGGVKDKWGNSFGALKLGEDYSYSFYYTGQSGTEEMKVNTTRYVFRGCTFEDEKFTIFIAGDSTAQTYGDHYFPQKGWGQYFYRYFNESVMIENHAIAGRALRNFYSEGRLDAILERMKPGDYLFIQFGHNDRSKDKPERYSTPEEFEDFLVNKYIKGCTDKGGIPVLLTPTTTNRPDENGIYGTGYGEYTEVLKKVSSEMNIPLIDVNKLCSEHFTKVGVDVVNTYFFNCEKGESVKYPDGVNDHTHFKEKGAAKVAELVARGVYETIPRIAQNMYNPSDMPDKNYEDLKGHWANSAVNTLSKLFIIEDIGKTEFMPEKPIGRAEFVELAIKAADISGRAVKEDLYPDIDKNAAYRFYVQAAKDFGLIDKNLIKDNFFRPEEPITREEMASVIVRIYRYVTGKNANFDFAFEDLQDASPWAIEYIKTAAGLEILKGTPENRVLPKKTATRAEAAVAAERLYGLMSRVKGN